MKVLLIGSAGKYGAQLSLVYLCKVLIKKGINVEVVLPDKGETDTLFEEAGITCYVIKNGLVWAKAPASVKGRLVHVIKMLVNCGAELKIKRIIRRDNIDIVHINSIGIGVGAKSALKLKKKLVWHIREFVEEDLNRRLYNADRTYKLVSKSDAVIAISEAIYEKYADKISPKTFKVIYNGVEPDVYASSERSILINDKIRIVVPGRICHEKGQYLVVEALERLNDLKEILSVEFCGDGNGNDEEYNKLKSCVKSNGWNKNVLFLGYCERMDDIYKKADIVIVPSKQEAFGRVTVEAMMAGCYVIGANSGGTKELLSSNRGMLFEFGNSKKLADGIRWVILNKETARITARDSRKFAIKEFSAEKNALAITDIYNEFI